MKNPVSKQCTHIHYVVSDLGLHCLSMAFNGFPIKMGYSLWKEKKTLMQKRHSGYFSVSDTVYYQSSR